MVEQEQKHRFKPSLNYCRSRASKTDMTESQQKNFSFYFSVTPDQVERAKRFATKNDGVIHQTEEGIQFECKRGHIWGCVVSKMSWCKKCIQLTKRERKQKILKEEEEFWQAQIEEQQALFSQAKRKYSDSFLVSNIPPKRKNSNIDEVDHQAKLQALDYVSENKEVKYEHSYFVYKILGMSPSKIRMLVTQSVEYHKLCLEVHPDKNKHPLATEAFQKITNAKNWSC